MDLQTILYNKDKVKAMPPEQQQVFLSMAFDHFVAGRMNLAKTDLDTAKSKWISSFLGKPSPPLPEGFARPPEERDIPGALKEDVKSLGGATALGLGSAAKGLANITAAPAYLHLIKQPAPTTSSIYDPRKYTPPRGPQEKSGAQKYFEKEAESFGKVGEPFDKEHPILGTAAKFVGQSVPGGALAKIIGPIGAGTGIAGRAISNLPKTAAVASGFSGSPGELAKNTAYFTAFDALLGGAGKGLKGLKRLFSGKAPEAGGSSIPGATKPPEPGAASDIKPPKVSVDQTARHAALDKLGIPANTDIGARERTLYEQGTPEQINAYEPLRKAAKADEAAVAKAASVPKSVQMASKEVKAAVVSLDREGAKRVAREAERLRKMRVKAGATDSSLSPQDLDAIKAGKNAEQIFNPVTQPEVVVEQPQVAKVAEMEKEANPPEPQPTTAEKQDILDRRIGDQIAAARAAGRHDLVRELEAKRAVYHWVGQERRAPASEAETAPVKAVVPAVAKAAKTIKVPDLGDRLLLGRYKLTVKAGKSVDEAVKLAKDDAYTLYKKIENSADSEAAKNAKILFLNKRLVEIENNLRGAETGRVGQVLKRPPSAGEAGLAEAKEGERIAASPNQSTKDKYQAFFDLYGRMPSEKLGETHRIDSGISPAEAVDVEFQIKHEEKMAAQADKEMGISSEKGL